MGSDHHCRDERSAHKVAVSGFLIDETTVTNAEFAALVAATAYVTVAERPIDPADYPGADSRMLAPGSLVFRMIRRSGRISLTIETGGHGPAAPAGVTPKARTAISRAAKITPWFRSHSRMPPPMPPGLARFADRSGTGVCLPRRPRRSGVRLGRRIDPGRHASCQHLAGPVPLAQLRDRRLHRHLPGAQYSPNGYGLYEVCGNVWEWTTDWFVAKHAPADPAQTDVLRRDRFTRPRARG